MLSVFPVMATNEEFIIFYAASHVFRILQVRQHCLQQCHARIFDLVILTIRIKLLCLCLFIWMKRTLFPAPFFIF